MRIATGVNAPEPTKPDRLWGLVPPTLARIAAWCGCLILIGIVANFVVNVVSSMRLVALPVAVALLLTALMFPLTGALRRRGMRPIWATWVTMFVAFALLGGLGSIIGVRGSEEFPGLMRQMRQTVKSLEAWLYTGPLHLKPRQLSIWFDEAAKLVTERQQQITSTVLAGTVALIEALASIVLLLFVTFFLLKDGDRIWAWFLRAFGGEARRVDRAGRAAWRALSFYVQGTVAVAAVHAVLLGVTLAIMGVPLWVALALLIFVSSFIPIIGIFFAGTVATLITLGTKGPIYALIFLGLLILEQQLENHVLQPQIVGRRLHFHPLAIIIVLAVGGILAGIAGAVVAVPIAAILYRGIPELFRSEPPALPPGPKKPDEPGVPDGAGAPGDRARDVPDEGEPRQEGGEPPAPPS
ncbi:AI-2E family transporter [Nonomuraea cavernae]|uniref:AI-2E family transporter n=1 Tax=Nonomuraea cavernae TaxID=2045107 RepID=A0A918DFS9_9ACTN|nr:AI-2E family transporter [Nonomuraea cavernae]MCA2183662.1 AI-2E family transporter [Nonomuraea cavernae]GGO60982.1 AI-2E family transporter [Nonomuraea cavernae]